MSMAESIRVRRLPASFAAFLFTAALFTAAAFLCRQQDSQQWGERRATELQERAYGTAGDVWSPETEVKSDSTEGCVCVCGNPPASGASDPLRLNRPPLAIWFGQDGKEEFCDIPHAGLNPKP